LTIHCRDTPTSIADRLQTSAKRIVAYNEGIDFTSERLKEGTRVFLEKKKKKYKGRSKYHTVKEGETMYTIAQLYGIRLAHLYSKNRMIVGKEPAVGEAVRLKGKARKSPKLRANRPTSKKITTQETKDSQNTYTPVPIHTPTTTVETTDNSNTKPTVPKPTNQQHIVQKGETLWRISKKYGITIEELMAKNNLQSTTIRTGTALRIR